MSSHRSRVARARLVGDRPNDWQSYHQLIRTNLSPGLRVLDVGCGVGSVAPFPWKDFPQIELIGIDPNPEAQRNPNLSRFELLTDPSNWPIEDSSIDLVLSRYVLEHVEKPDEFFANLRRVLKPGGRFIALTPNRFYPACIVSAMLSHSMKQRILRSIAGVDESDVFPTWYRSNTVRALRRHAQKFGFEIEHLDGREFVPNGYLDFCLPGFLTSYTYYQAVRFTRLERWLGASIMLVFRKTDSAPALTGSTGTAAVSAT